MSPELGERPQGAAVAQGREWHHCFKSFLQEQVSLSVPAGPPWLCGTSSHGCESTPCCSRLCLMMGMLPLEMAVPTLAGAAAKQRAPAHAGWELGWQQGDQTELPKCSLCPQPLLLSPPPPRGSPQPSQQPWMQLAVDPVGWVWDEGSAVPGFAQLCSAPPLTEHFCFCACFPLLSLGTSQERLLWLIDLMEVGLQCLVSVCGQGRDGLPGGCCSCCRCTATSCHPPLLSLRVCAQERSCPQSLVLQCTQGSA